MKYSTSTFIFLFLASLWTLNTGSFLPCSQSFQNSNCAACLSSSFSNSANSTCLSCTTGYSLSITSICTACTTNCLTCTDTTSSGCTLCTDGYYLLNGTCLICPDSCATCATPIVAGGASYCLTCAAGFYPSSQPQDLYAQKYSSLSFVICHPCLSSYNTGFGSPGSGNYPQILTWFYVIGCGICNGSTCVACKQPIFSILSQPTVLSTENSASSYTYTCVSSIFSNCFILSANGQSCQTCNPGYCVNNSGLCGACYEACNPGYYYNYSYAVCSSCPLGCATCSDQYYYNESPYSWGYPVICNTCASGYCMNFTSLSCFNCSNIVVNCAIYTTDADYAVDCVSCNTGYFLGPDGSCVSCTSITSYCNSCIFDSYSKNPICLSCEYGYYLSIANTCEVAQEPLDQNCQIWESQTACVLCKSGYSSFSACTTHQAVNSTNSSTRNTNSNISSNTSINSNQSDNSTNSTPNNTTASNTTNSSPSNTNSSITSSTSTNSNQSDNPTNTTPSNITSSNTTNSSPSNTNSSTTSTTSINSNQSDNPTNTTTNNTTITNTTNLVSSPNETGSPNSNQSSSSSVLELNLDNSTLTMIILLCTVIVTCLTLNLCLMCYFYQRMQGKTKTIQERMSKIEYRSLNSAHSLNHRNSADRVDPSQIMIDQIAEDIDRTSYERLEAKPVHVVQDNCNNNNARNIQNREESAPNQNAIRYAPSINKLVAPDDVEDRENIKQNHAGVNNLNKIIQNGDPQVTNDVMVEFIKRNPDLVRQAIRNVAPLSNSEQQ